MNPLALFTGPQGLLLKWAVIAFLVAAFGAAAWFNGEEHGTQKLIDYQADQATAAVRLVTRQAAITERVITKYLDRVKLIEGTTTTIEKEVTRYVESKPLALACLLDNRWLRLHDAAAAGAVPPAAGPADGAAGTVTAAAALPAITSNYAAAHRNAARLEALQGWVREQYEMTNGRLLADP